MEYVLPLYAVGISSFVGADNAPLDWTAPALIVCSVLTYLFKYYKKPPKQVLLTKTAIRALLLSVSLSGFAWSCKELGPGDSLLLESIVIYFLTLQTKENVKKNIPLVGVCSVALLLVLAFRNVFATLVFTCSLCILEIFHLLRDVNTLYVASSLCGFTAMVKWSVYPPRVTSRSYFSMAFLLSLLRLLPTNHNEERFSDWTEFKKRRMLANCAVAVLWVLMFQRNVTIRIISSAGLVMGGVRVFTQGFNSALLPMSVKDEHPVTMVASGHNKMPFLLEVIQDAIQKKGDSRKIFYFLCLTMMFMFVELLVGLFTNSLGLISDAGHMFFDSMALFIGLFASYASKRRPDHVYTYGYARYETIAGFVNALFLSFIAVFVLSESLERFSEPPEIRTEGLLLTSVIGLVVNGIGLLFFHEHSHTHSHGGGAAHVEINDEEEHGHSHQHQGNIRIASGGGKNHDDHSHCDHHSHGEDPSPEQAEVHAYHNENMRGVYLHVLADALGSIGVIVSSLLIQYKGWYIADPICSFFISIMIGLSVLPLLKSTASNLLLRVPEEYERRFVSLVGRCKRRQGVVRVAKAHLWRHSKDMIVATVSVVVTSQEWQDPITTWLTSRLRAECGATEITVQVCNEQLFKELNI